MERLTIKTCSEHKFITALLCKGRVTSNKMDFLCGPANSREVKKDLKNRGWPVEYGIIEIIHRDGQTTRPGVYFLTEKISAKTLKMVRNWEC